MESIRILADTSSDLTFDQAAEYGIELFSIPVFSEGKAYRDGIDFTQEEFYALLDKCTEPPTTSHIPLAQTGEAYLAAYNAGCEAVIHLCNNSANSGMFNTANLAKKFFFDEHPEAVGKFRIEPVDSHSFSLAYGLPAILGAKKRAEGGTVDEILEVMDETVNRVEIYMALYDLKFAKMSGRISAAAAIAGSVLGIRPIMSMINGVTATVDKVRGDKAVLPRLTEIAAEHADAENGTPFFCVAAGYPVEEAKQLEKLVGSKLKTRSFGFFRLGAAVAINAGPKVVAVFVLGKDRRKEGRGVPTRLDQMESAE